MKNLNKILACVLTAGLVAGLSALSVSADATRIEAETGTVAGTAAIVNSGLGADVSGGAWIGSLGADAGSTDTTLTLTVPADEAGKVTLTIAYNSAQDRSVDVKVNDAEAVNVATPASGSSWTEGIATATVEVELNKGDNTVVLYNATGWAPNIDYVEVEAAAAQAPETEAPETEAPETEAPETEAPETEAPETEAPETDAPAEDDKPAQTGDAAIAAVAVAALAIAGVAVVSKKRYSAE